VHERGAPKPENSVRLTGTIEVGNTGNWHSLLRVNELKIVYGNRLDNK